MLEKDSLPNPPLHEGFEKAQTKPMRDTQPPPPPPPPTRSEPPASPPPPPSRE